MNRLIAILTAEMKQLGLMIFILICVGVGVGLGLLYLSKSSEEHHWSRWSEPAREFGASVFGDGDVWTQRRVDTNTGFAEFRIVGRMGKRQ